GARANYDVALSLQPNNPEWLCNLGTALAKLGRTDEAVKAYQRALLASPGNPSVLNNLGRILLALGREEESLAAFQTALRGQPGNWAMRMNYARVLGFAKRFDALAGTLAAFE